VRSLVLIVAFAAVAWAAPLWAQEEEEADPPQVAIGERLFLETRFAQYFQADSSGDVNAPLAAGDPVVATTRTLDGPMPGPFAGQSMNCRACHLVDDAKDTPGGGNRSYADFARESPIPLRDDGRTATPRNSPSLVNATLPRKRPFLLHFDGEFPSTPALVRGTLTGRNYGWLPSEAAAAVAHVARVVREDDGSGALARDFGGAYRVVLGGTDPSLPKELRLPKRFRIDVARASDVAIVDGVARLVAAYVESLTFAEDDGAFVGSAYDTFLAKNHIPVKPDEHEPDGFYRDRIREFLQLKDEFDFVGDEDGTLALHDHPFAFGPLELQGLRIFLSPRRGNCAACHVPPTFTDFALHNTGVSQVQYDAAHGPGAFAALAIPDAAVRAADPDAFLPATPVHPFAAEPFRSAIDPARPGRVDLGVWNVFRNPDFPDRRHQRDLARLVCASAPSRRACRRTPATQVAAAVALFKTPGLRDLGHSDPYLHTGSSRTLEDVVRFYVEASRLARAGVLRNGAVELRRMTIDESDVVPLAAFLRALDEDYE